jgi:F-type H+-transporting ATPase subunit b
VIHPRRGLTVAAGIYENNGAIAMNASRIFLLLTLSLAALYAVGTALPARAADPHDAGAAKVEGETGHAAHGAADKPELLRGPKESVITAIVTLIVFVALVAVLGKTAWGPIAKGLQDREDKIRRDIEEAEAARAKAEATMKDYQAQLATAEAKVREMLTKATVDAEQIATNVRTRAQQDAQEIKENATKEIDSARRDAVKQVHNEAALLATRVAEKILRRNLNVDDQRALVETSLEQLQTIKG